MLPHQMDSTMSYAESTERKSSIVAEHERLREQIVSIDRSIRSVPQNVQGVVSAVREILELTRYHFEHEEALMAGSNYREFAAHKRDHDYLRTSLIRFVELVEHRKLPTTPDLGINLKSWLELHIKKYDDPYWAAVSQRR
jgi:hemerythrin